MQARRVQTLQARATQTVAQIIHLMNRIVDFVGQKQAMQNISANLHRAQADREQTGRHRRGLSAGHPHRKRKSSR